MFRGPFVRGVLRPGNPLTRHLLSVVSNVTALLRTSGRCSCESARIFSAGWLALKKGKGIGKTCDTVLHPLATRALSLPTYSFMSSSYITYFWLVVSLHTAMSTFRRPVRAYPLSRLIILRFPPAHCPTSYLPALAHPFFVAVHSCSLRNLHCRGLLVDFIA